GDRKTAPQLARLSSVAPERPHRSRLQPRGFPTGLRRGRTLASPDSHAGAATRAVNVVTRVAIIGAGPYGLATAAYLRRFGVAPLVLGRVMGAWERMPPGMLLRSFREWTSIGDPDGRLTFDEFERELGRAVPAPVPIADFVEYGRWFQAKAV